MKEKLKSFFQKRFFVVIKQFVWSKFFLINVGLVVLLYFIVVFCVSEAARPNWDPFPTTVVLPFGSD